MIERYLQELGSRLPVVRRGRVLQEVEHHLREAAAEVSEEVAIRRFGPPEVVARPLRAAAGWIFAGFAIAAGLVFPVLSYPVVENSLPPAPWPTGEKPGYLEWKQDTVLWLLLIATVAAGIGVAGWRRGSVRFVSFLVAVATLGALAAVGGVLSIQWADAVPGTPGWLVALWLVQGGLAVLAAGLTARATVLSRG